MVSHFVSRLPTPLPRDWDLHLESYRSLYWGVYHKPPVQSTSLFACSYVEAPTKDQAHWLGGPALFQQLGNSARYSQEKGYRDDIFVPCPLWIKYWAAGLQGCNLQYLRVSEKHENHWQQQQSLQQQPRQAGHHTIWATWVRWPDGGVFHLEEPKQCLPLQGEVPETHGQTRVLPEIIISTAEEVTAPGIGL